MARLSVVGSEREGDASARIDARIAAEEIAACCASSPAAASMTARAR